MHDPPPLPARGLLQDLPDDARRTLGTRLRWQHYWAGATVVHQGRDDQLVHFVAAGRLRASQALPGGREVLLGHILPGDLVGDLRAVGPPAEAAQVLAIEPSWLGALAAGEFRELLAGNPPLAQAQMRRMAGHVLVLRTRVLELSTLSASHRIRSEILRLAEEQAPQHNGRAVRCTLPPHWEIAERAATQREVVSRELKRLEQMKLIRREASAIVIEDFQALRARTGSTRPGD